MIITAQSPANIAFIKHWGLYHDENNAIKMAGPSLSMNLSHCMTTTRIELLPSRSNHKEITIKTPQGEIQLSPGGTARDAAVFTVVDFLLEQSGLDYGYRINSENSFPTKAGIASSASGFSALVVSVCGAISNLMAKKFTDNEIINAVKLGGSYSALRSLQNGFVTLQNDPNNLETGLRIQEVNTDLSLCDLVVILNPKMKKKGSDMGHFLADSSPFQSSRILGAQGRFDLAVTSMKAKNFDDLARVMEDDAAIMHGVMATTDTPFVYASKATRDFLDRLNIAKADGLEASWTLDAGENPHIICENHNAVEVKDFILGLNMGKVIENVSCDGAKVIIEK